MKHSNIIIRKRHLEPLRPILESWFGVLKEYMRLVQGDSPFWYRERPQVGFFALAAWSCGYPILEEWGMSKGSKRKPSQGRNDFWIGIPKEAPEKMQEWYFEAKHSWCEIEKGKRHVSKKLRETLKDAKESAKRITCESPARKIAIAFVSPVWKPKYKSEFKEAREEWIEVCRRAKADVVASFLLDKDDKRQDGEKEKKEEKNKKYIGSLILMVSVK